MREWPSRRPPQRSRCKHYYAAQWPAIARKRCPCRPRRRTLLQTFQRLLQRLLQWLLQRQRQRQPMLQLLISGSIPRLSSLIDCPTPKRPGLG